MTSSGALVFLAILSVTTSRVAAQISAEEIGHP